MLVKELICNHFGAAGARQQWSVLARKRTSARGRARARARARARVCVCVCVCVLRVSKLDRCATKPISHSLASKRDLVQLGCAHTTREK